MGNDNEYKNMGIGDVKIKTHDRVIRTLNGVRHVPKLKRNLVSFGVLERSGCKFLGASGSLEVSLGASVVMRGVQRCGLYILDGYSVVSSTYDSVNSSPSLSIKFEIPLDICCGKPCGPDVVFDGELVPLVPCSMFLSGVSHSKGCWALDSIPLRVDTTFCDDALCSPIVMVVKPWLGQGGVVWENGGLGGEEGVGDERASEEAILMMKVLGGELVEVESPIVIHGGGHGVGCLGSLGEKRAIRNLVWCAIEFEDGVVTCALVWAQGTPEGVESCKLVKTIAGNYTSHWRLAV